MGMAEAVAEKGWVATTVSDVISRAGVSRATFYEIFGDKLACFLEASKVASELMLATLEQELHEIAEIPDLPVLERIDRLVDRYLASLSQTPGFSRAFLVEIYSAGPDAVKQRIEMVEQFTDLVVAAGVINNGRSISDEDHWALAYVIVSALSSAATNALGSGQLDKLPELRSAIQRVASHFVQQP